MENIELTIKLEIGDDNKKDIRHIKGIKVQKGIDGTISLFKILEKLEKDKGFKILQNRISYLNHKFNCYEFCWCRNAEDNVQIPLEVYEYNGKNMLVIEAVNVSSNDDHFLINQTLPGN